MLTLVVHGRPKSKDNEKQFNRAGRVFLSDEYKDYERNVAWQVRSQLPHEFQMFTGWLSVAIRFYFKDDRRFDLFNGPKSICDALKKIVWKDDHQIVASHGLFIMYSKEERFELEVFEIKKPT